MGTYSVLLIDGPLTDEQRAVLLRRTDGLGCLESTWDRLSRYGSSDAPLTEADKTFWTLGTGVNWGARNWTFIRTEFVDAIREMAPTAAVYMTTDYLLEENLWTRAQWIDIAEGRRTEIHSSHVELLTDEAIAEWDAATAE